LEVERLRFLARVVGKQAEHLAQTDGRLLSGASLSVAGLNQLEADPAFAERVEAFVSRLSGVQDTVGDKLLPALLAFAGEPSRTVMENLDRAEKLGWLPSADSWLTLRKLCNQMVHEYAEDLAILADALNRGHESVPVLVTVAGTLTEAARKFAKG
jgi:hypothetical protein